jgi:hypothetical protein
VRIKQDRNFRKSQWFSFSTGNNHSSFTLRNEISSRHTFCNTPKVFPSLDNTAVGGGYILSRSDDGEGHGIEKYSSIFSSGLVIGINRRLGKCGCLERKSPHESTYGGYEESRSPRARCVSYSLFERVKVVLGQCIRLRNHGNEVYTRPETLHDLNVQGLEPKRRESVSIVG